MVKCEKLTANYSLTMSAGVLPIILKVYPVLGGLHTHTLSLSLTHTHSLSHTHKTRAQIFPLFVPCVNSSHSVLKPRRCLFFRRKTEFIPGDFLLSLHSHNTEVVEMCFNASSSSSYCTIISLIISPHRSANSEE